MKEKEPTTSASILLCPVTLGSLHAYRLYEGRVVGFFLGIIPLRRIVLKEVRYLRLATRNEVPFLYLLFNWIQFLPRHRSVRPVYILRTTSKKQVFLKLGGNAHFQLRQAIGKHTEPTSRRRRA
jgi:hypothetical protein